ncbi:ABC transporter substrate-binding protein [Lolliginicoccus suaedae]|uniref:ABC transporter substrate-binding protein n=1 Tax=Lolliginicoccus suaedae TaxID=2605429 RepID=UPI001F3D5323|nr:ABC transporter substrate-binding protein [Lolliginicoccus suaedae]
MKPRLAAILAIMLSLSACGYTDPASTSGEAFATVDTAYGELTLDSEPKRIVALTTQYVDMLAAIDVEPLAFSGGAPEDEMLGSNPWLEGQYAAEYHADLVTAEYAANLEAVAALEPDLILATTYLVPEDAYERISQIAPAYVGEQVGNNDWDVTFEALGELVGEPAAVDEAMAQLQGEFDDVRNRLPGFQGKTYNFVRFDGPSFAFGNGSWLKQFGLVPNENQDDTQADPSYTVSLENLDELDADALAIFIYSAPQEDLEGDPRFQQLPASQNGTVVFADWAVATAGNSPGPHSLRWLTEKLLPQFESSPLNQS